MTLTKPVSQHAKMAALTTAGCSAADKVMSRVTQIQAPQAPLESGRTESSSEAADAKVSFTQRLPDSTTAFVSIVTRLTGLS